MEFPCYGVEDPGETGFGHTPLEKGICREGAEGVIANFWIGGGATAVDEGKIVVC